MKGGTSTKDGRRGNIPRLALGKTFNEGATISGTSTNNEEDFSKKSFTLNKGGSEHQITVPPPATATIVLPQSPSAVGVSTAGFSGFKLNLGGIAKKGGSKDISKPALLMTSGFMDKQPSMAVVAAMLDSSDTE